MSCNIPAPVLEYIQLVESDAPRANRYQHALVALVRKAFEAEDLYVDEKQMEKYLGIAKYFSFERLFPWEAFIEVLWNCVYKSDGQPRWPNVVAMVGRGAGKDGFIGYDSTCSVSPYNPVSHYNVDICANNEEQAMTPVRDVLEVLESPKWETKLNKHFYHTKELVQGRKNKGVIKGRTNNPKGRDGMRSGKIIFNEVHQYQDYSNIKVFVTGLGKVAHPRRGFFTSNGDVNEGPLDDYLQAAEAVLFEGAPDKGTLYFICCLDDKDEVHDEANWYKANPSLQYLPHLLTETRAEYEDWLEHPEQNGDFMPKRMGIRDGKKEIAVTEYAKIKATNKPVPELKGISCTVGIDYAELSDWAAVNIHFRKGDVRYDINHAWVCTQSKTLHKVKAPWKKWAEDGHLTVVEDVSIHPKLLAEYIRRQGTIYNIRKIAMDNYRWTLVSEAMREVGIDASDKNRVRLVRPKDIMQIEPVIQECFDRELFCWGDQPHLRWAVNNTKRVRASKNIGVDTGNFIYAKIEARSRKTDPFMALVASMVIEDELGSGKPVELPPMGAIIL